MEKEKGTIEKNTDSQKPQIQTMQPQQDPIDLLKKHTDMMGDRTRAFFLLELTHKGEFFHSYHGATGDTQFLLWMGDREIHKLVDRVEASRQEQYQKQLKEMIEKAANMPADKVNPAKATH